MSVGVASLDSFLFFYVFFIALLIFLMYGLWELHKEEERTLPNPLSAVLLGIPEPINMFDDVEAVLQVKNCGEELLKKVFVQCSGSWVFSLEPGASREIPIKLNTFYAGRHEVRAQIYCRKWKLHIFGCYRVFQRVTSQKEKYLKVLGLKRGASKEEIKKARNRLAKLYHPDVEDGYEEKMKEINEAYHRLINS